MEVPERESIDPTSESDLSLDDLDVLGLTASSHGRSAISAEGAGMRFWCF